MVDPGVAEATADCTLWNGQPSAQTVQAIHSPPWQCDPLGQGRSVEHGTQVVPSQIGVGLLQSPQGIVPVPHPFSAVPQICPPGQLVAGVQPQTFA